jgi:uncharacterized protein
MDLIAAALVIVVTATDGYRHESIETAERVIASLPSIDAKFVRTPEEIPSALSAEALASARVVMFVNTTGELPWPERQRLLDWIAAGGSFIGVHSASDTWHEWPEYIAMLGGEFESHPEQMTAEVVVVDPKHPAAAGLKSPYAVFEEFYQFKNYSPDRVRTIMTLADGSPMAWWSNYGSGRVFYTALGHRDDVWTSPWFKQHLHGALLWALGEEVGKRRRAVGK